MATLKTGVLGGTFDPPHLAHLALAQHALEQLELDRVLWIPAGEPWRKSDLRVSSAEHRLAMTSLAVHGRDEFEVTDIEVTRPGPTYSVETLAALHARHPDDDIYLILGQDALEDVPNWSEPLRLLELATLAVAGRGGDRPDPRRLDSLVRGLSSNVVWIDMPLLDISSTDIRERVAHGQPVRELMAPAVAGYIAEHHLYQ